VGAVVEDDVLKSLFERAEASRRSTQVAESGKPSPDYLQETD
jgi:hypothetical protein